MNTGVSMLLHDESVCICERGGDTSSTRRCSETAPGLSLVGPLS